MNFEDEIKQLTSEIMLLRLEVTKLNNKNTSLTSLNKENSRLIPLTEWNNYHSWPKIGGLRHLVFHEKTNGASVCIKRIGRRVLIIEDEFFKWAKDKGCET